MPIQENFISWPHFSIDLQYKDVLHRIWKQEIVFCFNNLPEVLSGLQRSGKMIWEKFCKFISLIPISQKFIVCGDLQYRAWWPELNNKKGEKTQTSMVKHENKILKVHDHENNVNQDHKSNRYQELCCIRNH